MNNKNGRLPVLQNETIVQNTTCFAECKRYNVSCQRKICKHWIQNDSSQNCVLIAAQDGPHTLQKIGQIYGLTRMRICQLEKGIIQKLQAIDD